MKIIGFNCSLAYDDTGLNSSLASGVVLDCIDS